MVTALLDALDILCVALKACRQPRSHSHRGTRASGSPRFQGDIFSSGFTSMNDDERRTHRASAARVRRDSHEPF